MLGFISIAKNRKLNINYDELEDARWFAKSELMDMIEDKKEVANAVVFLMGCYSKKITGQVLHVDGGSNIIGGMMLDGER